MPDRAGGRPALGSLLVQRGFLDEEQLAAALVEQRRSGWPLGRAVVELGLLSAPIVAQALATQHGGTLKTEYGVAVGFDAEPGNGLVRQPPLTSRVIAEPEGALAEGRLRLADAAASVESAREPDEVLVAKAVLAEECGAAREEAAAAIADARMLAAELESAQEQVARLTSRIVALEDVVDPLRTELQAGAARQHALECELALVREERESARAEHMHLETALDDAEERLNALRHRVEAAFVDACRPTSRGRVVEQSAARLAAVLNNHLNDDEYERRPHSPPPTNGDSVALSTLADAEADAPNERHLNLVLVGDSSRS